MAVSKKRKVSPNKRRRKINPPQSPPSKAWGARLAGSRLAFLRKNPDFQAMIKVGRVLNANLFASHCYLDYQATDTAAGTRMYQRSFYALAGYTYQGMLVMKALQGRYLGVPEFEALRVLIHDKKYRQHREYLRAIRNFAAFHLDEYDVMTRSTLSQLKAAHYDLLSADSDTLISYYFQFADTIDMEFLHLKFGNGRSWDDTLRDISGSVLEFSRELVNGCFEFMMYLTVKSELHRYIEKRSVPYRNAEANQPAQDRMMRLWEKIKKDEEMEEFSPEMPDDD